MTYLQGIDISKHQGDVNHRQVAESGMLFCVCKATEGRDYEDPKFEQNIRAIREVLNSGLEYYPGAYHFARPSSNGGNTADGRAEAEDFCDVIERVCGSILEKFLPPALDFEEYSESDAGENVPWIEAWIEVVERRLGRTPMIYTGSNVWKYEVGNSSAFISNPLWQVYYSATAQQPPTMPWPTWALWQYSGGGSYANHPPVPGVGVVDVNRWQGTLEDFKRFAAATPIPPDPPISTWPTPPQEVDLNTFRGAFSEYVARVQGLLLSHRYGPAGLVGPNGLPDGKMGDKTEAALVDFKSKRQLPADAVMGWATWWALVYDKLGK